jgi:hypothetical protein
VNGFIKVVCTNTFLKAEFSVEKIKFDAILERDDATNGSSFVRIPFSLYEVFGVKGQLRVRGTINGHSFQSSMAPYGGQHYMMVHKALRAEMDLEFGATLHIEIEKDDSPREIEMPNDLIQLLRSENLSDIFAKLSFTNRKEYAQWILSAKRNETRQARLAKTAELLKNGIKNPSARK